MDLSTTEMGYVYALLSSVFFALYPIPRKFVKEDSLVLSFLIGIGFFCYSVVQFVVSNELVESLYNEALVYAFWAGVIWYASLYAFLQSIQSIGLARASQWKNLQGLVGVTLSLVFLKEYTTTNPVLALASGVLVFVSALALTFPSQDQTKGDILRGVVLALAAAFGFGLVTLINKYVTTHAGVLNQQVVWSFGIAVSAAIGLALTGKVELLRRAPPLSSIIGLFSGLLYLGASYFMLKSYQYLDASVSFTIIQLNGVWAMLIGLLFFHEIDLHKYAVRVCAGFIFAIAGVLVLSFV